MSTFQYWCLRFTKNEGLAHHGQFLIIIVESGLCMSSSNITLWEEKKKKIEVDNIEWMLCGRREEESIRQYWRKEGRKGERGGWGYFQPPIKRNKSLMQLVVVIVANVYTTCRCITTWKDDILSFTLGMGWCYVTRNDWVLIVSREKGIVSDEVDERGLQSEW